MPVLKEQLDHLGFVVDKDGLRLQMDKFKANKQMSAPTTKKDIQVFLGMVGNYWQFIHNFASTAGPLFHLLKNDVMFIWTEDCKDAFETLKNALCTSPVLVCPDFS